MDLTPEQEQKFWRIFISAYAFITLCGLVSLTLLLTRLETHSSFAALMVQCAVGAQAASLSTVLLGLRKRHALMGAGVGSFTFLTAALLSDLNSGKQVGFEVLQTEFQKGAFATLFLTFAVAGAPVFWNLMIGKPKA
jgi:hypothetical protein